MLTHAERESRDRICYNDRHDKQESEDSPTRLPDPALDIDDNDPDDQPVPIKGEPLSETILRERR